MFASFPFENESNKNSKHHSSDSFMSKKLARFVFPSRDIVDPSWVVKTVPPFEALQHLINLSWDRLMEGEMKVWDDMCGRRVKEKEVSQQGLHKTIHDLRKDRGDYKRECQRIIYIDNKKVDKNIKLKKLILSPNKTVKSSEKQVSQMNLNKLFKSDKKEIATYILECLNFQFSKSTKKILKSFQSQLFSSQLTSSKAKYFIRKLALCLWSIRAQATKLESPHGLAVLQLSTSDSGPAGLLPFARGVLCFGKEKPHQSQLVSFLVDSGSQINIMSLNHLK